MTSKKKTVLYVGVTSDLRSRIVQHQEHQFPHSFSDKYNLEFCIYYEAFTSIEEAISREKEIKKWRREKKESLINGMNPQWNDLWDEVKHWGI